MERTEYTHITVIHLVWCLRNFGVTLTIIWVEYNFVKLT